MTSSSASAPSAPLREASRLIHGESAPTAPLHTPSPPIHRGSTVLVPDCQALYDPARTTYGRGGMETQRQLAEALAGLEGADRAFLFPSGLSAITGTLLALTQSGDEVLASDSVYNPTRGFLDGTMRRFGVTARYFDPAADAETIAAMITPATRLIFLESPGSLTFDMQDVPAIARMARARGVLTVIDNSWSAGVLFKPLEHGVDVSLQALTKYVCGHSDVFMGMAAARGDAVEQLARADHDIGWAVSPDDAYMALRGLRTLRPRLAAHGAAALEVARWMQDQPEVRSILCPALPGAPGHALWQRDFNGQNGLFGAVLQPGPQEAVAAMLDDMHLFGLGFSWGGFESLVIPCDPQLGFRRNPADYGGPLLRFHVGLEDVADLKADLRAALDRYAHACAAARPIPVPA